MSKLENTSPDHPEGLEATVELLRAERPELDPVAADRVKGRILAASGPSATRRSGWRPRTTASVLLAGGIIACSTGGALGVSAVSMQGETAQDAQYRQSVAPKQDVLGTVGQGGGAPASTRHQGGSGGGPQAKEQVAQLGSQSELPFTGYAAIVVLSLGAVLCAGGLVLRRRLRTGIRA